MAVSGSLPGHVWTASDLSRNRKAVLSNALLGPVLVRNTDGTLLIMATAERLQRVEGMARIAQVVTSALALMADEPAPSALGELAFAADWGRDRRARFVADIHDVAAHAIANRNAAELEVFVEASRPRPPTGPVDPARIAALLADATDAS